MAITNESTIARRLRPLAAAIATLCAASADAAGAIHAKTPITLQTPANCNDSGPGSLRDAIANAVDGALIDMTHLACSQISLTTGALTFTQSSLTLTGPGRGALALDGNFTNSVIVHNGGSYGQLQINDLSIVNGFQDRLNEDVDALGGCVRSNSRVSLQRVDISNCKVSASGTYNALGGGVFAKFGVFMSRSSISSAVCFAQGSGYANGAGAYTQGRINMAYSEVSQNAAFSNTSGHNFGGGAFARGDAFIQYSSIFGNSAGVGGGLEFEGSADKRVTIMNSTISGNIAERVGGINSSATLDISNSTLAFNQSSFWRDNAGHHFAAGLHITSNGVINSTIISNNVNSGSPFSSLDATAPAAVSLSGASNNVMFCQDVTCPNDTTHEDPSLRPLQDNGGPTKTHRPTPGLWDRNQGSNSRLLKWDQRGVGFPRVSAGDPIEIGALQTNSGIIFTNGFN